MRVAIMQPYFFPYIGYFQLIAAVDKFIVYDNIKYTKKGWINRNRMLLNGADCTFSLPLKRDSDSLEVCAREITPDFNARSFLNQMRGAYAKAPFLDGTMALLERVVSFQDRNLFRFLHHSIAQTCDHLAIETPLVVSSGIPIDRALKAQDKVLALCKTLKADTYVNSIGGLELYDKAVFRDRGFELRFLRSQPIEYEQFGSAFVPWLSIIDVMMFNTPADISRMLSTSYELI